MNGQLVDLADPSVAPHRDDLPFLTHRARPSRNRAPSQVAAPSQVPAPTAAAAPPPVPAPGPAAPAATSGAGLLDLSAPPAATSGPPRGPAPAPPVQADKPRGPSLVARSIRTAPSGERTLLTRREPRVMLNRLQSGIGVLTIDAAASEAVGDLRIGCAYDLDGGHSSTVQPSDGASAAPRDSKTPVILGRDDRFERLQVDLRQNHEFRRLIVYGFSASDQPLRWGGTLIVTALGGTRVELPMDLPESGGVAVLMSIFNVGGEFVIRGEMEIIQGSVRDACIAYGFDRITWLDGRHPVT